MDNMMNNEKELKMEFVDNEDIPLDIKIKMRLEELTKLRDDSIEKLKLQQQLVMSPIEAVIAELTALIKTQ